MDRFNLKDMPPEAAFKCWCHVRYDGPLGGTDPRVAEGTLTIADTHPQCPMHGAEGVDTIRASVGELYDQFGETFDADKRFAWEQFVRRLSETV